MQERQALGTPQESGKCNGGITTEYEPNVSHRPTDAALAPILQTPKSYMKAAFMRCD